MSEPAPYCPETVKRMRTLSESMTDVGIAGEFGWTVARVRDAARRHAIAVAITDDSIGRHAIKLKPAGEHADGIAWDKDTKTITRHGAHAVLSHRQAAMFDLLLVAMRSGSGEHVRSIAIAEAAGTDQDQVATIKIGLDDKIVSLLLEIASGRKAGYWLIDLAKGDS